MSKLYCAYCHEVIDEDEIIVWQEKIPGFGDDPDKCEHHYCPICHEEGMFEEMGKCALCGEDIVPEKVYCSDCDEAIGEAWRNTISEVRTIAPHRPTKDIGEIIIDWLEWNGIL